MPAKHSRPASAESAVQRAVAYTFLAHCFAYPDSRNVAALEEQAAAALPFLAAHPLTGLVERACTASSESLEESYVRLFTLSSSPDCPTYETAYLDVEPTRQSARMAAVSGFYQAFGVAGAAGASRPDDLPVELEFMGFLCKKQIYAAEHLVAARVAQARRAQRLFLSSHLGRWAPAFAERVSERTVPGSFYAVAAGGLTAFIAAELVSLRIRPGDLEAAVEPGRWEAPGGYSHGPEGVPATAGLIDPRSLQVV